MSEYVISDADLGGGDKVKILTRTTDKKAINMNVIDLFIDLAHDHPEVAQPMVTMLYEMRQVKEFRSAVQA